MKKAVLVVLLVLLAMGGIFAEGQKDDEKISMGYTFHSAQDVFSNMIKNEFVAAAEAEGVEVTVIDPLLDIEKQVAGIETFISLGVDAIVCQPLDYAGLIPGVKMANDAGIPFISINSEIDPSAGEFTYVGSLNYDAGAIQGEHFAKVLPQGAKIVYLRGTEGMDHTIQRRKGVQEKLLDVRPDVVLLAEQTALYDRAEGMMVMEDWIQAFPQIDAVLSANDQMALGALEALKGAGIEGVLIGGIDGTTEAKQNVKNGTFSITVLQNAPAQAKTSFDVAMKLIKGEQVDKRVIIPFEGITAENIDDYM